VAAVAPWVVSGAARIPPVRRWQRTNHRAEPVTLLEARRRSSATSGVMVGTQDRRRRPASATPG
jgi:hypothetical protein